MKVRQILKEKGDDGVVTVSPDAAVSDAVQLLSQRKIGTVVASADGRHADGILSERDIVREMGARGAGCLTEVVGDMMTRDLQTCGPDDDARDVLARMTEGRFRHMPVLADGEMVGMISLGDVVKARLDEVRHERNALRDFVTGG
ncbi:MAG: CBS domain-containing protein [Hasllibacter sp.]